MVGVPGKFKGCETCRLRRVKCDNERPLCKKCIDSGRECAGYERQTVFIVGTVQDGGRCSSHPPRVVKNSRRSPRASPGSSSPAPSGAGSSSATYSRASSSTLELPGSGGLLDAKTQAPTQLFPLQPLQPAWDDLIGLSDGVSIFWVKVAALHLNLGAIYRNSQNDDANSFNITLPPYAPARGQPSTQGGEFVLQGQCLLHLDRDNEADLAGSTGSVCFFPYEHNFSAAYNNLAPWSDPSIEHHFVRRTGPAGFQAFPNHHFFARVYRPNALYASLLRRQPTFLSAPEWVTTPWELHPKSSIDRLLDTIILIPALLSRADHILPSDPTLPRRLQAQDLLSGCLNVERLLDAWEAAPSTLDSSSSTNLDFDLNLNLSPDPTADPTPSYFTNASIPPFWIDDDHSTFAPPQIPFADPFTFRDGPYHGALAYTLRWAAQVLLRGTMARLQQAIFAPLVDVFPPTLYPSLPTALQLSPARYGGRAIGELASCVCRSLDAALRTGSQPDLLLGPLGIVEAFYSSCEDGGVDTDDGGDGNGDGSLELLWCEGFRARMALKGQEIAEQHVVRDGVSWVELARY